MEKISGVEVILKSFLAFLEKECNRDRNRREPYCHRVCLRREEAMELGKGQEGQWERRIERVMDSVLVSLILCTVPKLVAMIELLLDLHVRDGMARKQF